MLRGGIAQGVPCTETITWCTVRPHLSSNHSWLTHQSSLAVTNRHLVAKQDKLGKKHPRILPTSIFFILLGSLTWCRNLASDRQLYFHSEVSRATDLGYIDLSKIHRPRPGFNLRTSGPVASKTSTRSLRATVELLVDWLWWGETDVSELRPLRAYYSSLGDCDVDHGMMVSTGANS
jgi:hypothetical protein